MPFKMNSARRQNDARFMPDPVGRSSVGAAGAVQAHGFDARIGDKPARGGRRRDNDSHALGETDDGRRGAPTFAPTCALWAD